MRMSAMGRMRPVTASAGFSALQSSMLDPTAEFGQYRSLVDSYLHRSPIWKLMMKRISVFAVVGLVGGLVTGFIQAISTYLAIGVGRQEANGWYIYYLPWFVFLVIGFVQSKNKKSNA